MKKTNQNQLTVVMRILRDLNYPVEECFNQLIAVLSDIRTNELTDKEIILKARSQKNGFSIFWSWVEKKTKRKWSYEEIIPLWRIQELNASKRRDPIPFSHKLYMSIEQPKKCFLCKKKTSLEIHHKVPVSKGGKNNLNNYKWCCSTCNKKIGNRNMGG